MVLASTATMNFPMTSTSPQPRWPHSPCLNRWLAHNTQPHRHQLVTWRQRENRGQRASLHTAIHNATAVPARTTERPAPLKGQVEWGQLPGQAPGTQMVEEGTIGASHALANLLQTRRPPKRLPALPRCAHTSVLLMQQYVHAKCVSTALAFDGTAFWCLQSYLCLHESHRLGRAPHQSSTFAPRLQYSASAPRGASAVGVGGRSMASASRGGGRSAKSAMSRQRSKQSMAVVADPTSAAAHGQPMSDDEDAMPNAPGPTGFDGAQQCSEHCNFADVWTQGACQQEVDLMGMGQEGLVCLNLRSWETICFLPILLTSCT